MADKSCSVGKFLRLALQRQKQGELSMLRQVAEMMILYPFYGVGPGFYQLAGFWQNHRSWREKTGHLTSAAFNKRCDVLNPLLYHKLSQHKVAEKALYRILNIPSSEYLGFLKPVGGVTYDGHPLCNHQDFLELLQRRPDLIKVCFKPVEGWGGQGFYALEVERENHHLKFKHAVTKVDINVADFFRDTLFPIHKTGTVIETYLEQHAVLSNLNPSSVNTIRIWARKRGTEAPIVLGAYLRIGLAGSLIDNQSAGGIVAAIDLETGVLGKAIDGQPEHMVFSVHPDHAAPIEGVKLPMFPECLALAKRVLESFPGITFVGMDMAVAADGPRIIEINVTPDRVGAVYCGGISTKEVLSL